MAFLVGAYLYGQLLGRPDGKLHVRFLDVGQGDSVFITTLGGSHIIIDGGPGDRVLSLVNQFMPWGDRKIDLMLLTHSHADHLSGLTGVLKSYDVKNIIYEPDNYPSRTYEAFIATVRGEEKAGARVLEVKTGDTVKIGPLTLKIIWDPKNPNNSNANNQSIVTELELGDFEVFLPGDAQEAEAQEMTAHGVKILPVEVYKVAHHGSRNGLNPEMVKRLSPKLSVIQVGKDNAYGHPHKETLDLLKSLDSVIKRTDLDGTIEVVSDGVGWDVR